MARRDNADPYDMGQTLGWAWSPSNRHPTTALGRPFRQTWNDKGQTLDLVGWQQVDGTIFPDFASLQRQKTK